MEIDKKRRSDYTHIDPELLLKTYNECGRSINKTAEVFGTSDLLIRNRFKDYELEYDTKVIYSLNHDYFDVLGEHQMYWLGYLITDGCVRKHNYSYMTQLSLATKDIYILEKFKEDLEFTGPIHSYIRYNDPNNQDNKTVPLYKEEYYSSVIQITSKKIFDRLGEFEIIPNKTYTVKFPEKLRNHPLLNHFIRGCIDGDGWIRLHANNGKDTPNCVRVGFCGIEIFVKEILNVIKSSINIDSGSLEFGGGVNWKFEIEHLHDVDKLVNWLYKDATIYLPRKYENAKFAKEFASRYHPFIITKEKLEEQYNNHRSIIGVAKANGVDPMTIKNRLLEFEIDHKTNRENTYNINIFSDNNASEIKYYWAGYLSGKSTFVDGKYPKLMFSSADKEILEKFNTDTDMSLDICNINNDTTRIGKITYTSFLMNKEILLQLSKFNINDKNGKNILFQIGY